MITEQLERIKFLKDVTAEHVSTPPDSLKLFLNSYKVFQVEDCPSVLFKISADWDGYWLTGVWYYNNKRITSPDELLTHLSRSDINALAYELDILEEISTWNNDKPRYIRPGVFA